MKSPPSAPYDILRQTLCEILARDTLENLKTRRIPLPFTYFGDFSKLHKYFGLNKKSTFVGIILHTILCLAKNFALRK
ncbi:hypothetical protein [uncultured Helicobacter sp.]|uniref:hypothetical protein n=1 Tax=uncultured Helicobacter sp. TaxID=175537 RepID=UPI00374F0788